MPSELPAYPFIIIASLIGVLGAIWIQRYIARRSAAKLFRERLMEALSNFYPSPGNWRNGFEGILSKQIKDIGTEVGKFRFYVPKARRPAYDADWAALSGHATELTWEHCAAFTLYPSMHQVGDRDPRVVFYELVERLLAYAKES